MTQDNGKSSFIPTDKKEMLWIVGATAAGAFLENGIDYALPEIYTALQATVAHFPAIDPVAATDSLLEGARAQAAAGVHAGAEFLEEAGAHIGESARRTITEVRGYLGNGVERAGEVFCEFAQGESSEKLRDAIENRIDPLSCGKGILDAAYKVVGKCAEAYGYFETARQAWKHLFGKGKEAAEDAGAAPGAESNVTVNIMIGGQDAAQAPDQAFGTPRGKCDCDPVEVCEDMKAMAARAVQGVDPGAPDPACYHATKSVSDGTLDETAIRRAVAAFSEIQPNPLATAMAASRRKGVSIDPVRIRPADPDDAHDARDPSVH